MRFQIIPVTPYEQNCSLVWCETTGLAALVDPGGDADRLLAAVEKAGVKLDKLLLTHAHLDHVGGALELARGLLAAGFPVIVDATFLKRDWRDPFAALAGQLGIPWHIAAAEADPAVLRERVARRQRDGRDASEAGLDVLEAQLASLEPFADHERPHVLRLNEDTELASHLQKTAQP